jgi:hypothetical protein
MVSLLPWDRRGIRIGGRGHGVVGGVYVAVGDAVGGVCTLRWVMRWVVFARCGGGDSSPFAPTLASQALLGEKDENLRELRETVDILEVKIQKLEQLVR